MIVALPVCRLPFIVATYQDADVWDSWHTEQAATLVTHAAELHLRPLLCFALCKVLGSYGTAKMYQTISYLPGTNNKRTVLLYSAAGSVVQACAAMLLAACLDQWQYQHLFSSMIRGDAISRLVRRLDLDIVNQTVRTCIGLLFLVYVPGDPVQAASV